MWYCSLCPHFFQVQQHYHSCCTPHLLIYCLSLGTSHPISLSAFSATRQLSLYAFRSHCSSVALHFRFVYCDSLVTSVPMNCRQLQFLASAGSHAWQMRTCMQSERHRCLFPALRCSGVSGVGGINKLFRCSGSTVVCTGIFHVA